MATVLGPVRLAGGGWIGRIAGYGLLSLVSVGASGCVRVATVRSPGSFIAATQPQVVWLYWGSDSVMRVDAPRLIGDTVVGTVNGTYTELPLTGVSKVTAVQVSAARTAALATVGAAATIAALVVAFRHAGGGSAVACGYLTSGEAYCSPGAVLP